MKPVKRPPLGACRERALAWVRDPAAWAWAAVGLLALLPLGAALAA